MTVVKHRGTKRFAYIYSHGITPSSARKSLGIPAFHWLEGHGCWRAFAVHVGEHALVVYLGRER